MAGEPYPKERQLARERKPYRRRVASAKSWAGLRDAKLGPCLLCQWNGRTQAFPSTLHHVVPRGRGGDDVADNLVSLCGSGTSGCHGLVTAGDVEACRGLAAAVQQLDGAVYAYAVEKLGEDGWLRLHRVRFDDASATKGTAT